MQLNISKYSDPVMYYDMELQIPNMNFLKAILGDLREEGQLSFCGICFFSLRRFTNVNQRLGRKRATEVMGSYIRTVQQRLQNSGCVCRVGGDNFIAVFEKEMLEVIVECLQGVAMTYDVEKGKQIVVSANAGIYIIDSNDPDDDVIDKAHLASLEAKKSAGAACVFYDEKLRKSNEHVYQIEAMFGEAMEKEEFLVYYQPKVRLDNYSLAGAEALCRWEHDGRIVPPMEFIPVLEQSDAICDLDFYMLDHVCRDLRRWIDEGKSVVRVSVNMSRRHMGDPNLLRHIIEIIDHHQVPHEYIEIELTETTTDVDFQDLKVIVTGLRESGIHTSVDDFGEGYSSLNLIRQLPWDMIKMDKSFLPYEVKKEATETVMLHHLLSMIQDMGIACIVEGVENVEQVKLLKENKCYLAQGFYFDKPLPVEEFEERLQRLGKESSAIEI